MPLFKGVPNKTIKAIVPLFRLEEHAANAKIFDYGAPGDKMYILIQGVTPCMQVLTTAPLPLPHRYVFVQGVIPNLQAHQAGVQAGSIVLGIDRGFGWADLAGVSCDETIVQIEESPRPFSLSMRPPPGFADDDTGDGALPLGQAGQPNTLDRSALPVGFGGRDLVNPGRVRFAGAAGVASPDDDALPAGQLETLCARHESSSETETLQRQRSARSAAKPAAAAMVALEEVPQVRGAAQKKQQYGALYMPNVPQQLSPGRHEAMLLAGLRPPPAPRSVSLKELSHLRSLIAAGMQESEAHRVLEAARETPHARAHLESVLAAQGSSAGMYAGDPTWEEYQARDSRLKELDGMLSEGMMSGAESDGTAPPDPPSALVMGPAQAAAEAKAKVAAEKEARAQAKAEAKARAAAEKEAAAQAAAEAKAKAAADKEAAAQAKAMAAGQSSPRV